MSCYTELDRKVKIKINSKLKKNRNKTFKYNKKIISNDKMTENEIVDNKMDITKYIFDQIKLMQEIRDRWSTKVLIMIGASIAAATFAVDKLESDLSRYSFLFFTFVTALAIEFAFLMFFICQRKNYRDHYRIMKRIQDDAIKSAFPGESEIFYAKGRQPFGLLKRGADFWLAAIHFIIIDACAVISLYCFAELIIRSIIPEYSLPYYVLIIYGILFFCTNFMGLMDYYNKCEEKFNFIHSSAGSKIEFYVCYNDDNQGKYLTIFNNLKKYYNHGYFPSNSEGFSIYLLTDNINNVYEKDIIKKIMKNIEVQIKSYEELDLSKSYQNVKSFFYALKEKDFEKIETKLSDKDKINFKAKIKRL